MSDWTSEKTGQDFQQFGAFKHLSSKYHTRGSKGVDYVRNELR